MQLSTQSPTCENQNDDILIKGFGKDGVQFDDGRYQIVVDDVDQAERLMSFLCLPGIDFEKLDDKGDACVMSFGITFDYADLYDTTVDDMPWAIPSNKGKRWKAG